MPIYGYACKNCDHQFDALQKMADDVLVDCPACDESQLKRQLSAPRFRLKGKGWYETDFKKDNQRNLAGDTDKLKSDTKVDKKSESNSKASSTSKPSSKSSGSKASTA
jgi:putative FmdB family regulatory protein